MPRPITFLLGEMGIPGSLSPHARHTRHRERRHSVRSSPGEEALSTLNVALVHRREARDTTGASRRLVERRLRHNDTT